MEAGVVAMGLRWVGGHGAPVGCESGMGLIPAYRLAADEPLHRYRLATQRYNAGGCR